MFISFFLSVSQLYMLKTSLCSCLKKKEPVECTILISVNVDWFLLLLVGLVENYNQGLIMTLSKTCMLHILLK